MPPDDLQKRYYEKFYEQIGAKIAPPREVNDPNKLYRQVVFWKNREGEEVSLNTISPRYAKNIVAMVERTAPVIRREEMKYRQKKYGSTSRPEYLEVSMITPSQLIADLPLYKALKALADSE